MSKFRKKPVVIEAEQWWPTTDKRYLPVAGVVGEGPDADGSQSGCGCALLTGEAGWKPHIHTLEGPLQVSPGDWIITGVQGEKYACKPDIFEATYEVVGLGEVVS